MGNGQSTHLEKNSLLTFLAPARQNPPPTTTQPRQMETRYLQAENAINDYEDHVARYGTTTTILSQWKIKKNQDTCGFLHTSLTLAPALSSSTSSYTITVLAGPMIAEDLDLTEPKSRILEMMASSSPFFEPEEDLGEFSDVEIGTIYDRFLKISGAFPWEAINRAVVQARSFNYRTNNHILTREEVRKWEDMFESWEMWRDYRQEKDIEETRLREFVGTLLCCMLAVDMRWGVEGCGGVLQSLGREKITLVGEGDFVYEVRLRHRD